MLSQKTGYFLVLLTAIISGFSIFLNKFAVSSFNPFVFTGLKNLIVAVFLFSAILLFKNFFELKSLSKFQWARLSLIGLVGGSIPFLLFFFALQSASALSAGFLHKTIFIFASLFAFVFLKERLGKKWIIAAGMLLLGNFFMFNLVSSFALADLLVLGAVLFWAFEQVLSKHVLKELSGRIVAFGRMFFGSAFILCFLAFSGQLVFIAEPSPEQWLWAFVVSVPLFFYVLTYYSGLERVPVSKATAILMLGQPITLFLSLLFLGESISLTSAVGIVLVLSGLLLLFASSFVIAFSRFRGFALAKTE